MKKRQKPQNLLSCARTTDWGHAMSYSVDAVGSASQALQSWAMLQEKDNNLLRQVLDNQSNTITNLIEGAVSAPELANSGTVGTRLHVVA